MISPRSKRREDTASLVLINARLIDPSASKDEIGGVVVEDGIITQIGPQVTTAAAKKQMEVVDCRGQVLAPGLVDMRVFTGEPGLEHRETLASATKAAATGGITTMITMPNTDPVLDNVALVDFIKRRARDTGLVHVHPWAALTKNLAGEQMTEIGLLQEAGAVGFSDGGHTIADTLLLRRTLAYAKQFDALISVHAEDPSLASEGVMNEGEISTRLGLPGIPDIAETIIVERDLRLMEITSSRLHFAQLSARSAVDAVRAAKSRKSRISCGVSITHLLLNENDIGSYRTFYKLSPPLRSEDDRTALIEGLVDGTIDVIVSSHNPQSADTKRHPFAEAAQGAIGLETLLPAALSLHQNNDVPLMRILETLTSTPAKLLGLEAGTLAPGACADMILIDLNSPWIVNPDDFHSKSKNTSFEAHKMQGRCVRTFISGRTIYEYSA